ncbi:hypothetical protein SRHO_G00128320 [Serrasalmus rhombeus]
MHTEALDPGRGHRTQSLPWTDLEDDCGAGACLSVAPEAEYAKEPQHQGHATEKGLSTSLVRGERDRALKVLNGYAQCCGAGACLSVAPEAEYAKEPQHQGHATEKGLRYLPLRSGPP